MKRTSRSARFTEAASVRANGKWFAEQIVNTTLVMTTTEYRQRGH